MKQVNGKTIDIPRFRPKKPRRYSHHPQPGYVINGKVWIEKDGELYIGWGRVMLLERIDKFGSVAKAARSMGLAYRNAWLWVESMNKLAPTPLVEKRVGGVGGGYARVTEEGARIIAYYKELRTNFDVFLNSMRTNYDNRGVGRNLIS